MKITFNIDYHTTWGEWLYMVGDCPALGGGDAGKAAKMAMAGVGRWTLEVDLAEGAGAFSYGYVVRRDDGGERREWGVSPHRLVPAEGVAAFEVHDHWRDAGADKPFFSSVFTECINRREGRDEPLPTVGCTLTIDVEAPTVGPDEVVAICGDQPAVGAWDPAKALVMNDHDYPRWTAQLSLRELTLPLSYKFVVLDRHSGELRCWEAGDNRVVAERQALRHSALFVQGQRLADSRPAWRCAGVAIPVFAVRTADDFGVGDFYDLMKMVDWAVATGQKFLQILPINDTTMTHTWTDSYPYNACSTFALHPMYVRLERLGLLADPERMAYYEALRGELNASPTVDYERVTRIKGEYMREIYAQEGKKTLASDDYREFCRANAEWLRPYAAFCTLRDINGTPDFSRWGRYADYQEGMVEAFIAEHVEEVNFVCYVQYHLDRQMRDVHEYARAHGVAFKGDIPIGISRDSVDAWVNPRLYNMDSQAGAPPDDFSVLGQNWGFPTYNWEEMARDGFAWWRRRFRKMADYFDAYRIDHVLGFFRIWQIPMTALHGLLGVFNPALPYTPDELRERYGFWLDVEAHTRPYVRDYMLRDFFGEHADEARRRFLVDRGEGRYAMRPEFDTQRKVADYFAAEAQDDKNRRLCDGLLGLLDEVLFIEDPVEKGKYHPRISAQFTYAYRALPGDVKWQYNLLYDDFFYHRHNDFWQDKAMRKLPPLLDATPMLTCAEDLGMIPACVPAVMASLQMLSLEIQRMPKDPQARFGDTWRYPYLSVCTTSTHDMGGLRCWWEENRDATQAFFNDVLREPGQAPQYAEPWVCERILDLHLKSPSMLAILPLQDWLSMSGELRRQDPRDEVINVPANPRHYWRYRMHLTVEQLLAADGFNDRVRALVAASGR